MLLALTAFASFAAGNFPKPGKQFKTPVMKDNLDAAAFKVWLDGTEKKPSERGSDRGPAWILWTQSTTTGHGGLTFCSTKKPGPRHVRFGFKAAVPVGTVLTRGNVSVSVLRTTAAYPGQLGEDAQWLAGQRLERGKVTTSQASHGGLALWVFPAGTTTRALRVTHVAKATDSSYNGWLGGALVLKQRLINLAPYALASSKSNNRHAARINNSRAEGWHAWDNRGFQRNGSASGPIVSRKNPEWLLLVWAKPVTLNGLIGVETGFGAMDVLAYTGPKDLHPRDADDKQWKQIYSASGFQIGYPTVLWPNSFPFPRPVTTRAIRIRITDKTAARHPHVKKKPMGGRRVWLGDILACRNIGAAAMKAPDLERPKVAGPHPPIPITFTLPEAGYVTLVIEDQTGKRIRNLVSETPFPAGKNTAWWDGTDDLGRDIDAANHGLYNIPARFVQPGTYRARGLWRKEIEPIYEFPVYANGNPPWSTPDHTGAWLANHSPPQAALFVPATHSPTGEPSVFLGCYVTEGPDGFAWVDLNGRKRGGIKRIGGIWTAAPFLARDTAPKASTNVSAYVASTWRTAKGADTFELRLNALNRVGPNSLKAKEVFKLVLNPKDARKADANGKKKGKKAKKPAPDSIGGLAAYNGLVACAMQKTNRILFINVAARKIVQAATVQDPRGMVYDASGRLFVLSGTKLLRANATAKPTSRLTIVTVISEGLEDPFGVALDAAGNIYVSDHGSSHQVKVFTPAGKLIRKIGRAGKPGVGLYDKLHMNNPAGIAIDARNQLWVAEHDPLPKRVSVWTTDGKFVRAFYGPGKYGGGGMLDKHHKERFYYADEAKGTLEFKLDWEKGKADLVAVLYRRTAKSLPMPFRAAAPEMALYRNGKRYFTNCFNTNPTSGHATAFIYIERDHVACPAAAIGLANQWGLLKTKPFLKLWPKGADPYGSLWRNDRINQALFIWGDASGDGKVQPDEVQLQHVPVRGITVMDDLSFCVAQTNGKAMRFRPTGFTNAGVPLYEYAKGEVIAEGVHGPKSSGGCQMLVDDSDESVLTLGVEPFSPYSVCGVKNGKAMWSYPNPWPGLHASHHAAKPDRPGQLIGVTRLLGSFIKPRNSEVGPIWAVNGNMGNFFLMTRDGLFVATVFKDSRQGRPWRMSVAKRGMSLKGVTLHDENFWPSISQTPDGTIYAVDGSHCSLVRLDGLDTLKRLAPMEVKVTPENLEASQQYVMEREALRQKTFGSGVLTGTIRRTALTVDGKLNDWNGASWVEIDRRGAGANFNSNAQPYNIRGTIAVHGDRLYAAWKTNEKKLLINSGEMSNALFKTGGALDLMLAADVSADAKRRTPVAGDLRLLVTMVKGKTKALLYRPVVPGTPADKKIPFSSPWRTIAFDQVLDVSDKVKLAGNKSGNFEISIPLRVLGLKPRAGMRMLGDIGILRGNGSETTARTYWSNKATGITADVPSEAMLVPHLWGTIEWKNEQESRLME